MKIVVSRENIHLTHTHTLGTKRQFSNNLDSYFQGSHEKCVEPKCGFLQCLFSCASISLIDDSTFLFQASCEIPYPIS